MVGDYKRDDRNRRANILQDVGSLRDTRALVADFFRWLKAGILEKSRKNRSGWRLFTEEDLIKIRAEVKRSKLNTFIQEVKNDKVSI